MIISRRKWLARLEPFVDSNCPAQDRVALRVLKIIDPVKFLFENYYDSHLLKGR